MTPVPSRGGRTRIKVCCIRSAEEVRAAVMLGADAVGFVAQRPPSPRTIPDMIIASLVPRVPPPVASVLLSSEKTAETIAAHVAAVRPSVVQILHPLDRDEVEALHAMTPAVRKVQVVHVSGDDAIDLIPFYSPFVDAFLLDSGHPHAAEPSYGGTGVRHDWSISARFVAASPLPVFLAGGLSASNAVEAIATVRPFGLDLCTGVRTDGRLDQVKLAKFMLAVREADQGQA